MIMTYSLQCVVLDQVSQSQKNFFTKSTSFLKQARHTGTLRMCSTTARVWAALIICAVLSLYRGHRDQAEGTKKKMKEKKLMFNFDFQHYNTFLTLQKPFAVFILTHNNILYIDFKLSKPKLNQQLNSTEFEVRLHSYPMIHPTPPHPTHHHHHKLSVVVVNCPAS